MLLKTVYQWDIHSEKDLDVFRVESQEIDHQVDRVLYRRSDNIAPGEMVTCKWKSPRTGETFVYETRRNTAIPFMGREEFLARISEDMGAGFLFEDDEEYDVYIGSSHEHETRCPTGRHIPRQIVIRAAVEHRGGTPVRAEFVEVREESLAERPDPNEGGIMDIHWEESTENLAFVVEDREGNRRVDYDMFHRIRQSYNEENMIEMDPQDCHALNEAMKRACRSDMDDYKDRLRSGIKYGIRDFPE